MSKFEEEIILWDKACKVLDERCNKGIYQRDFATGKIKVLKTGKMITIDDIEKELETGKIKVLQKGKKIIIKDTENE